MNTNEVVFIKISLIKKNKLNFVGKWNDNKRVLFNLIVAYASLLFLYKLGLYIGNIFSIINK